MDVMADLQAQTDILFHLPLDLLGFVHFGLLALLVGLFLSCRFDSGLPSFFVSGFLTVCSFFAFCFHVSASVVAADYLIFMLPDFVMTFIFAGSFGAVVCRSKDPRLLALHLCSILGTMMCLGLATLGALSMGPPILDDTLVRLSLAICGFALVHVLCAVCVYSDALKWTPRLLVLDEKVHATV